tara:strand:+ start:153 stop:833 length:681 start_codon:yes stop_codon:yes gene_type:complete
MKIHNIFPLTIVHDKIEISEEERAKLVDSIFSSHAQSNLKHNPENAWTGDVHGFEFLLKQPDFNNIASLISKKIFEYLKVLSINTETIDLYFQRSWATITDKEQKITFHTHSQSNISFAYYLLKPTNSGGIVFRSSDPANAISKNIFVRDKLEKGLLETNPYNANEAIFDTEQDSILIFPSKSSHGTMPNKSGKKRISISGDVSLMLKDSKGFEHLMPNYKYWQKL